MTGPDRGASSISVLVVAPFRRDAAILQDMLAKHGMDVTVCADPADLARSLVEDGAALVMTQEALTPRMLDVVSGHLAVQPGWSELPLILLLDGDHQTGPVLDRLRVRLPSSKLSILQRPVRAFELVTATQTAMAARRRQLQLRDHMEWQEEMQRELNHRVKNTLANVEAIYRMTIRQSDSLEDFAERFEGRLTALSSVHSALAVSDRPRAMAEIADLVLAPYRSASAERIAVAGPPLDLAPRAAVTMALCLHELATNAAKYGALSAPRGKVSLAWTMPGDGDAMIRLCWTETDGPPVTPPSRRGYGTSFVRTAMTGGLGGTVDLQFNPEGLVCAMSVPAESFAALDRS